MAKRTMKEVHEAGEHRRSPRVNCPDCRPEAIAARQKAEAEERERWLAERAEHQKRAEAQAYVDFVASIDDLSAFTLHEVSAKGANSPRGTGWMKQLDSKTADLMALCGRMMRENRALMDVCLAIVRGVNPHASRAEWEGQIYAAAREALRKGFDDVEKRSGPESYRFSECQREFRRDEKLLVLMALESIQHGRYGYMGWAADRLIGEIEAEGRAGRDGHPYLRSTLHRVAPVYQEAFDRREKEAKERAAKEAARAEFLAKHAAEQEARRAEQVAYLIKTS